MLRGTSGYAAVDKLSNGQLVEVGEDTWLALDAEKLGTEPNHSERTGEPMGGGLGGRDSESDGHNESFTAKPRREEGAGGGGRQAADPVINYIMRCHAAANFSLCSL